MVCLIVIAAPTLTQDTQGLREQEERQEGLRIASCGPAVPIPRRPENTRLNSRLRGRGDAAPDYNKGYISHTG